MVTRKLVWVALLLGAALLAQAAVSVPRLDGEGFQKELAKRKGKVVVVNLWATWCAPCRAEFPALVKLYNNYRSRGVEVIVISVDDVENEPKVAQFLQEQKAKMPAFIKKPGDSEKFINAVDRDWPGAIPYTIVYDRNGKPFARMLGDHTFAQFEATVKKALAKRK
ncbi:MAG: TlpA disulfide reductase family protein [Armatimonadota bacterium]|nr:TlpA family protein disulfide reductase [bacterium]MDW8320138.1 TlpA disulfide reductase family protein [Armatimonadota bacterium]